MLIRSCLSKAAAFYKVWLGDRGSSSLLAVYAMKLSRKLLPDLYVRYSNSGHNFPLQLNGSGGCFLGLTKQRPAEVAKATVSLCCNPDSQMIWPGNCTVNIGDTSLVKHIVDKNKLPWSDPQPFIIISIDGMMTFRIAMIPKFAHNMHDHRVVHLEKIVLNVIASMPAFILCFVFFVPLIISN